jgi:ppGpp synthetase/RelA/SpoT-type nucleotidyltranferase
VLRTLETEHTNIAPLARRCGDEIEHQLRQLIDAKGIALSLPIQKRTKTWVSIQEKLDRKALNIGGVKELTDLIGLRIIVQFTRDLTTIRELVWSHFKVVDEYDTGDRLKADQFGYSSVHFVVELSDNWLSVPSC